MYFYFLYITICYKYKQMNRSHNNMNKRRSYEKPKSEISFAPIAIKCAIFNQNTGHQRSIQSNSNINVRTTQKTIKAINKITSHVIQNGVKFQYVKKIPQLYGNSSLTPHNGNKQLISSYLQVQQMVGVQNDKNYQLKGSDKQDSNKTSNLQLNTILKSGNIVNNDKISFQNTQDLIFDAKKHPNLVKASSQNANNCRKNIYRSRKQKRKAATLPKKTIRINKIKIMDNPRLIMCYRYQPISLITVLGKKQEYFNILKRKSNSYHNVNYPPLKIIQIQQKLMKQLDGRKDKGRKNFTNTTNQQLRSMNHKPRSIMQQNRRKQKNQAKNQCDDEEEEQSQCVQQQEQQYPDMQTWKRKNNVSQNSKVFIVKGGYAELRNQFLSRGWVENEDVYSKYYDMKWTTKICDIDYGNIKNGQIVNHFNNNQHLTSKYGITKRLKTLILNHGIDIDQFYPRCYDLGDQIELQNFIQDFKFTYVQSLAKKIMNKDMKIKGSVEFVETILQILNRRYDILSEKAKKIVANSFPVVTAQEWKIITRQPQDQKFRNTLAQKQSRSQNEQQQQDQYEALCQKISEFYDKNNNQNIFSNEQQNLTGTNNIWIAKPNFLSRGRGIKCFNQSSLSAIADYCLGKDTQFVVQKYIENPLLLQNKKFDIRLWVVITDFNPPKIYFYEQCYLRFCTEEYSSDINNRYVHLTNNSIQKNNKSKKQKISQSMWFMKKFIDEIGEEVWEKIKKKIQNIIVWSIKSCEGAVTGKKGSFQLVGFDFMIDQLFNPWLIEINMSPSMDYSTPVTDKLVKMVLKDTANLIINNFNNKNTQKVGQFTCIYEGDQDLPKFNEYNRQ